MAEVGSAFQPRIRMNSRQGEYFRNSCREEVPVDTRRGRYQTAAANSWVEDAEKAVVGPFLDRLGCWSNWRGGAAAEDPTAFIIVRIIRDALRSPAVTANNNERSTTGILLDSQSDGDDVQESWKMNQPVVQPLSHWLKPKALF